MFGARRRRRERELVEKDRWRVARRLVDEDVTALGVQVAELHVDTLADDLDPAARDHYRRALDHYDQAKHRLSTSETAGDVLAVEQVVADARFHRAAVLAIRDGEPLPQRRDPCFFDPRHGPSMQELEWTPPGGTPRVVPVCAADARRVSAGEEPLVRLVRVEDRWVPWHLTGSLSGYLGAEVQMAQDGTGGLARQQALAQAHLNRTTAGTNGGVGLSGR